MRLIRMAFRTLVLAYTTIPQRALARFRMPTATVSMREHAHTGATRTPA